MPMAEYQEINQKYFRSTILYEWLMGRELALFSQQEVMKQGDTPMLTLIEGAEIHSPVPLSASRICWWPMAASPGGKGLTVP